jgi:hypothetical protein
MAKDMTKRNINSYRQYRKIVEAETLEELTRQAEEKHRQWLHKEAVERMKKDTRAKRQIDLEKEKQRHELSMANVAVLLNTIKRNPK